MTLRRKLMIVLLLTAVLPMLAVRAVQAFSIYRLQNEVADDMRERLNDEAEQDMRRTVEGYANSLDQLGRLGLSLLNNQAQQVTFRLIGPPPRERLKIPSVREFARYESMDDGPYAIEPSMRHAVVTSTGELEPLLVSYDTQVYLSFDPEVTNDAGRDVDKLANMTRVYRELYEKFDEAILWQYTSLESGMHFSYPGKSAFAADYNPKQQPWYERAVSARAAITSQPYVDAATGQLVITLARPVAGRGQALAGVTAIDLRVSALLDPNELNTDWANEASVIVVASHPARLRQFPSGPRAQNRPSNRAARPDSPDRDRDRRAPLPRQRLGPGNDDNDDQVADTSYPADVYVVADTAQKQSERLSQDALETVQFDRVSDRELVTDDLVAGRSGVRRVTIAGQDRMIAYGRIGSGSEGRPVFAMIIAPTQTIQKPAELAIAQIDEDLTASLVNTGGILILLLLAVLLTAFVMSFRLTRPIVKLADAARLVAGGNLDARVSVDRRDELGQLGDAFNEMVPALRDRMKIRESLAVAMQVQQSLLPAAPPKLPGLDIAGHSEYCDETGGDYYDFIELDQLGPNTVALAVGDVTGHGIAAALLMATGRALIRSHANTTHALGEVFSAVNRQLCDSEFTGRFMTLMYLVVQSPDEPGNPMALRFLSAGHDPIEVYRPAEDRFIELDGHDIPLGIDPNWQYKEETSDALRPGDVLVVGTDGIWECFDQDDQQFGKDRMRDVIRQSASRDAQSIARAISAACRNWRGRREQNDDITLVVVKLVD
ncbi:MAG: SpoIIE family protein phosphatase [Phycisphaeraceae bacterium]